MRIRRKKTKHAHSLICFETSRGKRTIFLSEDSFFPCALPARRHASTTLSSIHSGPSIGSLASIKCRLPSPDSPLSPPNCGDLDPLQGVKMVAGERQEIQAGKMKQMKCSKVWQVVWDRGGGNQEKGVESLQYPKTQKMCFAWFWFWDCYGGLV